MKKKQTLLLLSALLTIAIFAFVKTLGDENYLSGKMWDPLYFYVLKSSERIQGAIFGEDTIYSENYRENMFRLINKDDSKGAVVKKIGHPIRAVELISPKRTAWIYSGENTNSSVHNFRIRSVEFNEDGFVYRKEMGMYFD